MKYKQLLLLVRNGIIDNLPTILTSLGVAGVVGTSVLASSATLKADQEIKETVFRENHTKLDVLQVVWKYYIPTVLMGSATVACIIGSNKVNIKRNIALAGAYSIANEALKEYRDAVVDTIGANKENKIRDKVMEQKVLKTPVSDDTVILTGRGDTLCFDAMAGRYFKSNIDDIKKSINIVNDMFLRNSFGDVMTLNDVYYELGLPSAGFGEYIGWHIEDGILDVRYTSVLNEHTQPCLCIEFELSTKTSVELLYNSRT